MASSLEIAEVRENTDEPTQEEWSDPRIGELIDENGVAQASAIIWRKKAAKYAELVDVSEAGASHSFSDLQDKALKMADLYEHASIIGMGRVKIHVIDR